MNAMFLNLSGVNDDLYLPKVYTFCLLEKSRTQNLRLLFIKIVLGKEQHE